VVPQTAGRWAQHRREVGTVVARQVGLVLSVLAG
jgi:hypothetical protein